MAELKRPALKEVPKNREYLDPLHSDKKGLGGFLEVVIRRFKNLAHLALVLPLYILACALIGASAAPGVALYRWLSPMSEGREFWFQCFWTGAISAASFITFGMTMLFVLPLMNFVMRTSLKPWRGPYYSLEAIRWYIHNGLTYLARYTFLEFVTPTPFNLAFYQMMGMKIGSGTAINTTWISDPSMIEIGNKVTIGGSVCIVAHYGQGGFLVLAPVKIGDCATIGLKASIMGGAQIGANAKVLPHSVVMPKTIIPDGETWGGVPARRIDG